MCVCWGGGGQGGREGRRPKKFWREGGWMVNFVSRCPLNSSVNLAVQNSFLTYLVDLLHGKINRSFNTLFEFQYI